MPTGKDIVDFDLSLILAHVNTTNIEIKKSDQLGEEEVDKHDGNKIFDYSVAKNYAFLIKKETRCKVFCSNSSRCISIT